MPTSGPGAARAPPPAARSLPYQAPHGIPAPTPTEAELGLARYKARHKLRAAQKASGITAHTAADEAARLCAREPTRACAWLQVGDTSACFAIFGLRTGSAQEE